MQSSYVDGFDKIYLTITARSRRYRSWTSERRCQHIRDRATLELLTVNNGLAYTGEACVQRVLTSMLLGIPFEGNSSSNLNS